MFINKQLFLWLVHMYSTLYSRVEWQRTFLQFSKSITFLLMCWHFTVFFEGIRLPSADGGWTLDAGKMRTMENSSYVDENLLIINPGGNDGDRQQQWSSQAGGRWLPLPAVQLDSPTLDRLEHPVLLSGSSTPVYAVKNWKKWHEIITQSRHLLQF